MPADYLTRFPVVREANFVTEAPGGHILAAHVDLKTREGMCPFLGLDDKCTIYHDRPAVCRKFGDESTILMTCRYQSADGRIRDRAERRRIEKLQVKENDLLRALRDQNAIS